MMKAVYNFASGPAILPREVMQAVQAELLDWGGRGYSVLETSHRWPDFMQIMAETEQLLRELLSVPDNYHVLFMQGGGTQQFAMVPLNLLGDKKQIDVIMSGYWTDKAAQEARRYGAVRLAADTLSEGATRLPDQAQLDISPQSAYVYYCANETIHGLEYDYVPQSGAVPLVADASSNLLSRAMDVAAHGLIFACAQKNFGLPGLTVVVVRKDLVGRCAPHWPAILNYQSYADTHSLWNTPVTFAIYLAHRILKWLKDQGGVAAIEQRNIEKAALLYRAIDESEGFYANRIAPRFRSRMNAPFSLRNPALEADFLASAQEAGLVQLQGHRSVGGLRASMYNAMPLAGVQALVDFMHLFMHRHG